MEVKMKENPTGVSISGTREGGSCPQTGHSHLSRLLRCSGLCSQNHQNGVTIGPKPSSDMCSKTPPPQSPILPSFLQYHPIICWHRLTACLHERSKASTKSQHDMDQNGGKCSFQLPSICTCQHRLVL